MTTKKRRKRAAPYPTVYSTIAGDGTIRMALR